MSNYIVDHFSNTVGTVIVAVALATQVAPVVFDSETSQQVEKQIVSSTHGQYSHPVTGAFVDAQSSADVVLAEAYEDLLAKSVTVDGEIEAVINDNLWLLYEG